jgi:hypothetical protein
MAAIARPSPTLVSRNHRHSDDLELTDLTTRTVNAAAATVHDEPPF